MIYGLFQSAQGAAAQSARIDVIANNLANASTGAFKRQLAIFRERAPFDVVNDISSEVPGNLNASSGGVELEQVATDFSDGPLTKTGGTFDIALSGPGFFRVSDGQQDLLTRNGQLTRNNDGDLVMSDTGLRVMGTDGTPIRGIAEIGAVEIASDGTIRQISSDGGRTLIGRLDLVNPRSTDSLVHMGNGLYQTQGPVDAAPGVAVRQGYLEGSGTNSVAEMMQMIQASRAFEMNLNVMKFQDEALGQLLQSVARA